MKDLSVAQLGHIVINDPDHNKVASARAELRRRWDEGEAPLSPRLERPEDKMRLQLFRLLWGKGFLLEYDMELRFAKSIIASSGPIRNEALAEQWQERYGREGKADD